MRRGRISFVAALLLTVLISCERKRNSSDLHVFEKAWTKETLNTINNQCVLLDTELNPPVEFQGHVFNKMSDQISYRLSARKLLIKFLDESDFLMSSKEVGIIENYTANPTFIIRRSDESYYSIKFSTFTDYENPKIEKTQQQREFFIGDKKRCNSEMRLNVLRELFVVTIISKNENGVNHEILSVHIE